MTAVTLTESEATAILCLLKSLTYDGLSREEGLQFQATLVNLGERIEETHRQSADEQYALWERLGSPGWENSHKAP